MSPPEEAEGVATFVGGIYAAGIDHLLATFARATFVGGIYAAGIDHLLRTFARPHSRLVAVSPSASKG